MQTRALDEGRGREKINATMDATVIKRTPVPQPPSRHALRNADPEAARSEEHLGDLWELMDRAIDYRVADAVFCYRGRTLREREAVLDFGCHPSNPGQWMDTQDKHLDQWQQDARPALHWMIKEAPLTQRPKADYRLGHLDESLLPHQGFEEFMDEIALKKRAMKKSLSELKTSQAGREFELIMCAGGALRARAEGMTQ